MTTRLSNLPLKILGCELKETAYSERMGWEVDGPLVNGTVLSIFFKPEHLNI